MLCNRIEGNGKVFKPWMNTTSTSSRMMFIFAWRLRKNSPWLSVARGEGHSKVRGRAKGIGPRGELVLGLDVGGSSRQNHCGDSRLRVVWTQAWGPGIIHMLL